VPVTQEDAVKKTIAVIAPGAMGAAVGARLADNDADVITLLEGRSRASAERAEKARMRAATEEAIAGAEIILSIVPPKDALGLAQRLAPHLRRAQRKPIYVDCNAVSPETARRIGAVIAETGAQFVDGGIIGGPPRAGYNGPVFYVSGQPADKVAVLTKYGLVVRRVDGPVGAASALKMSYASITKGLIALGSVSILAASKAGAAPALFKELSESQPHILAFLSRGVPDMFSKAYRWVAEMQEIAGFTERDASQRIYEGIADLYEGLAEDEKGPKADIEVLASFFKPKA
jgi:3-hydroxyisobutyrate dehydrogenase-like beta-hydroxyacid dehydrogenase